MPSQLSRRSFLGYGAAAAAAVAMMPSRAFAGVPAASTAGLAMERELSFVHTHTGERLSTAYCTGGEYVAPALKDINVLLRDFRANAVKPIDPALLDLLFQLNGELGTDQPFQVISGYRTPETNAMLQERGGSTVAISFSAASTMGVAAGLARPNDRFQSAMSVTARSSSAAGMGADISTIFTAAASSTDCPDERLISTFSTLPSLLIDTVKSRLP